MNNAQKFLKEKGFEYQWIENVKSIEWKAHDSNEQACLFYRLPNQEKNSIDLMGERLKSAKYLKVITNAAKSNLDNEINLSTEDFVRFRALLADEKYPIADKKLIGITGTNGKTTTVDLIRQLCIRKNVNVITVGTLGLYLNNEKLDDFSLTSPDFIDLRKALYLNRNRFELCALEASSHAIEQGRIAGLEFSSIGWTSFSQDHLDYHGTMDIYFNAKKALSNQTKLKFNVSFRAKELVEKLGDSAKISAPLLVPETAFFKSEYNKINLDVAIACLKECGMTFSESDLEALDPPPGRFNIIENKDQVFVIDFAHTPDAIENITRELKESFPGKELVCVFGCGGDRDKTKRPLMAKAASMYSDHIVITSDNPRSENPDSIIADIEKGIEAVDYIKEASREVAIKLSVERFKNAVILIAGKGHETYIEINGKRHPYSDEDTLRKYL